MGLVFQFDGRFDQRDRIHSAPFYLRHQPGNAAMVARLNKASPAVIAIDLTRNRRLCRLAPVKGARATTAAEKVATTPNLAAEGSASTAPPAATASQDFSV